MKKDTHPNYRYIPATCSCGNTLEIGTVLEQESLQLDVCSNCHPFYTGKQKLIDISGRVETFRRRYGSNTAPVDTNRSDKTIIG